MDIETFYRYVLLAETKSVSRAAEQGYLSRQTLSDSMTKLEQELGIRLFIRRKRGLELTEAGEELLRFLKGWLPEWEQETRTLSNLDRRDPTVIRVGVGFSTLSYPFFQRMIRYGAERKQVTVEYQDFSPQECFALLDQFAVDAVCMLDCGERPGCLRKRLPEAKTEPMLMMHESHPLAQKSEIHVSDLKGMTMVMATSSTRQDPMLDRYAAPFGAIPLYVPIRNERYSLNVMKERMAVGLSSNRNPNPYEKDGFVTRPMVDYPMDLSCYVYYRRSAPAVVKDFVDYFVR